MSNKSKGMSLPIEMIVVIAVAVLVMVVITVFFVGDFWRNYSQISDYDALTRGCNELTLRTNGCNSVSPDSIYIQNYNASYNGVNGNTLRTACNRMGYLGDDCKRLGCRCPQ